MGVPACGCLLVGASLHVASDRASASWHAPSLLPCSLSMLHVALSAFSMACCMLHSVRSAWHLQQCRLALCCMAVQVVLPQAAASTTGGACLRCSARVLQARIPLLSHMLRLD